MKYYKTLKLKDLNYGKANKEKSPAGRKPIEDKKVVINLFIRQSELDKRGGKERSTKAMLRVFRGVLKIAYNSSAALRSAPTKE